MHGALDAVQGLNPWLGQAPAASDLYLAYDPLKAGTLGDYETIARNVSGTQISLGPSAHALARHAPKLAVVNGIWMGPTDLGHPFAAQYMTSGRTQERAPHAAALVATARIADDRFLVINGPIERGDVSLKILQTVNIKNGLVDQSGGASGFVRAYTKRGSHLEGHQAFVRNREAIEKYNVVRRALTPEKVEPSERNGIVPPIMTFAGGEHDDIAAVAALSAGLASIVQLDWSLDDGGSVDNHVLYKEIHPVSQRNRWDRFGRFLDRMELLKLLENTLVLAVTEFTRTPAMNSNQGKDHNYSDNSVVFAGAGIKGGTVLGGHRLFGAEGSRSASQLSGEFVDFADGTGTGSGEIFRMNAPPDQIDPERLPKGVDLIRPPDVLKTALELVEPGLGAAKMAHEAKVLPKIVAR